jgi:hypothetical protein
MINIRVFIVYGGDEGKALGNRLHDYLHSVGLDALIASPEKGDLISGQDLSIINDFQQLKDRDVVVVIVTKGLIGSKGEKEINYLFDNNLQSKIVCFTSSDTSSPSRLNSIWRPIHFPQEMPEETFPRLQNEILRNYILRNYAQAKTGSHPLEEIRYSDDGLNKAELEKCRQALLKGYLGSTIVSEICSIVERKMEMTPEEKFVYLFIRTIFPKKWFVGTPEVENSFLFSEFGREIANREVFHLQEQLLLSKEEKINLTTFSYKELMENLKKYDFKPDVLFVPIEHFVEINNWFNEKGEFIPRFEPTTSDKKIRQSLYLNKEMNPQVVFSNIYRPLIDVIAFKKTAVKWHIKCDSEFGALSIRLGNSKLWLDKVELLATTTIKCEVNPKEVIVFGLPLMEKGE